MSKILGISRESGYEPNRVRADRTDNTWSDEILAAA